MSGKAPSRTKPNDPHRWHVVLSSLLPNRAEQSLTTSFVGTVDGALDHADELECEVDFEVTKIVITRGERVSRISARLAQPLRPKTSIRK